MGGFLRHGGTNTRGSMSNRRVKRKNANYMNFITIIITITLENVAFELKPDWFVWRVCGEPGFKELREYEARLKEN